MFLFVFIIASAESRVAKSTLCLQVKYPRIQRNENLLTSLCICACAVGVWECVCLSYKCLCLSTPKKNYIYLIYHIQILHLIGKIRKRLGKNSISKYENVFKGYRYYIIFVILVLITEMFICHVNIWPK